MAHLLAPKPPHRELPVFFNVDGVVGAPPAQNMREDVLLVQFAIKMVADSPRPTTGPEVFTAARAVRVTGSIDPATINAIRVIQEQSRIETSPVRIVDGRVSPSRGSYRYGSTVLTIANLNNFMQDRNINIWPRIDHLPGCPAELKAMVTRQVVGV